MKKTISVMLFAMAFTACSKDGGSGNKSDGNNPAPAQVLEKTFEGRIKKFEVAFLSSFSGNLSGGPFLGYQVEINSNVVNKGDLNIYDCQNATCSTKFLIYKMICDFDWLTCQLTDSQGNEIKKDGEYKANANDVGEIQSAGNCLRFTGGAFKKCFYLTLVDPKLKQDGYYDQYFATEFVPKVGPKTELNIFHLQHRP